MQDLAVSAVKVDTELEKEITLRILTGGVIPRVRTEAEAGQPGGGCYLCYGKTAVRLR